MEPAVMPIRVPSSLRFLGHDGISEAVKRVAKRTLHRVLHHMLVISRLLVLILLSRIVLRKERLR